MIKKLQILTFFLLLGTNVLAQSPESISYQVVARDASGNLIAGQLVGFRLSILQGSPSGTLVYAETHAKTSDPFGVVTLAVGAGTVLSGTFSAIDWGATAYYLKTELDPAGGSSYQLSGITRFLSVPYAFYAKKAGSGFNQLPSLTQEQIDTLTAMAGTTVLNTSTNCLNYYTGTFWMEVCGNCTPQPSVANAGTDQTIIGTATFLDATTPTSGTGQWEILSGTGGVIASPGNPQSSFSGNQPGVYTLKWTVSTVCGSTSDQVTVSFINNPPPPSEDLLFAPYADCTLWPNFNIENVAETGIYFYTCAFIVDDQFATGANPCWGGYSTLGMDYYQDKITSLRSQGGDIIMSFGGANGVELSYVAADEYEARNAYKTVIDAYSLTSIDFDIEGFFVSEPNSILRRSKAMKLLQNEYPLLKISLTLPVLPTGITGDGLNVVQSAIGQNVDLSCVNIMAMDYGPSGIDMGDAAISAGEAVFLQLKTLYQNAGMSLPDSVVWGKIGVTPMIGENDIAGEVFYQSDATDLAAWAVQKEIGRLSMWSANRDKQCTAPTDPLYSCSHITQYPFEFADIFGSVAFVP